MSKMLRYKKKKRTRAISAFDFVSFGSPVYFYFDFITNYDHKRLCSISFRPFHMENVVYTFIHWQLASLADNLYDTKSIVILLAVQLTYFPFDVSVFTLFTCYLHHFSGAKRRMNECLRRMAFVYFGI